MSETEVSTDTPEEQNDESYRPQKRSAIAIVLGFLIIAFCLWFFAIFAAVLWDPPDAPYGVIGILPGSWLLWIAFRQYRSLFSCEPWEMNSLSGCFIAAAIPAILISIIFVATMFDPTDDWSIFAVSLSIAVILTSLGPISISNNRKRGLINNNNFIPRPFGKHPPLRKRFWKRDLLGLLVLGGITAGMMAYFISTIPPEHAENVSYEKMYLKSLFPKDGRDFCYRRGMRGTLTCEFTIDERGFCDWIASNDKWEYYRPIEEGDWIYVLPRSAYETDKRTWDENEQPPGITNGISAGYGDHRGARAVFDRATNRAYYWTFY